MTRLEQAADRLYWWAILGLYAALLGGLLGASV